MAVAQDTAGSYLDFLSKRKLDPKAILNAERKRNQNKELVPGVQSEFRQYEPQVRKKIRREVNNELEAQMALMHISQGQSLPTTPEDKIFESLDFEQFVERFREMEPVPIFKDDPSYSSTITEQKVLHDLYMLNQALFKRGGYFEVTAHQQWPQVAREATENPNYFGKDEKSLRSAALKYLYRFERKYQFPVKLEGTDYKSVDPGLITDVPIFQLSDQKQRLDHETFTNQMENLDVFILRNFSSRMGIDQNIFDMDTIAKEHGEEVINIMNQDPEVVTFGRPTQKLANTKIKVYVDYMKQMLKGAPAQMNQNDFLGQKSYEKKDEKKWVEEDLGKSTTAQSKQRTHFGVNIDMENYKRQINELVDKVPNYLMCDSELDIQQHLRAHVLGMTIPQLYMKVKGVWTGGHQENLCLRAANINFGPQESLWYAVPHQYVGKMNAILHEKYGCNIYQREGMWFGDQDFCLAHNIPLTKFYQRPGDLVVLKPGTLHWVRSMGVSVQSAWNFGHWNYHQIQQIVQRYRINQKYNVHNLIHVKLLFVDLLNEKLNTLEPKTAKEAIQFLLKEYKEEQREMSKLRKKIKNEKDANGESLGLSLEEGVGEFINMTVCEKSECGTDLFQYFFLDQAGRGGIKVMCLKCAQQDRRFQQTRVLKARWDQQMLEKFMEDMEEVLDRIKRLESGEENVPDWKEVHASPEISIQQEIKKTKFFKKEIRDILESEDSEVEYRFSDDESLLEEDIDIKISLGKLEKWKVEEHKGEREIIEAGEGEKKGGD